MCDVNDVSSKCEAGMQVFFLVSKWPSATVTWFGEQICFLWTTPPANSGRFGFWQESGVVTDHSHVNLQGNLFLYCTSSERTSFSLLSSAYLCRYVISASVQREISITFFTACNDIVDLLTRCLTPLSCNCRNCTKAALCESTPAERLFSKAGCNNSKRAALDPDNASMLCFWLGTCQWSIFACAMTGFGRSYYVGHGTSLCLMQLPINRLIVIFHKCKQARVPCRLSQRQMHQWFTQQNPPVLTIHIHMYHDWTKGIQLQNSGVIYFLWGNG